MTLSQSARMLLALALALSVAVPLAANGAIAAPAAQKGLPSGGPAALPDNTQSVKPAPPAAAESKPPAEPPKDAVGQEDAASSRNAARTRMRECGHQWSTMKKNGTANGMTFKDFSQGCLARK